jgi:hypothetical protein
VAASVDPLATVDDLTTYLGHPPANPQQAEWMLDGASAFVRTHCGWSISRETDVVWPRDIMAVVCGLSSRMASAAGKGSATVQRVGNVQTSYNRDGAEQVGLTGLEQAALDRYRIRLVG